jgi:hypothetical protein
VTSSATFERIRTVSDLVSVEPMTGIEPAYSAWEVGAGCPWTSERIRAYELTSLLNCGDVPVVSESVRG